LLAWVLGWPVGDLVVNYRFMDEHHLSVPDEAHRCRRNASGTQAGSLIHRTRLGIVAIRRIIVP